MRWGDAVRRVGSIPYLREAFLPNLSLVTRRGASNRVTCFPEAERLGCRLRIKWLLPAAAATMLVLPGCSHGSTRLAGHWRGVRPEGVDSRVIDSTTAFATHMRIDVKDDLITVTTPKDTRTDHYKVVQEDKTKTVIVTGLDGDNSPQTLTFSDAKTMRWVVSSGVSVVFVKE